MTIGAVVDWRVVATAPRADVRRATAILHGGHSTVSLSAVRSVQSLEPMSKLPEEVKKTLSAFKRLMFRIDSSARPEPAPGYLLNCYGTYDDAKLTEDLLKVLGDAKFNGPEGDYVRYLHAAALHRARRFPESIQTYKSLANGHGAYAEAASLMVVLPLWNSGDLDAAQAALDEHNERYKPEGRAPQFRSARDMCVPRNGL